MRNLSYNLRWFICLLAIIAASSAFADFNIVDSGKPVATIVVPVDTPQWTQKAADWLQEYVEKASGAKLPT